MLGLLRRTTRGHGRARRWALRSVMRPAPSCSAWPIALVTKRAASRRFPAGTLQSATRRFGDTCHDAKRNKKKKKKQQQQQQQAKAAGAKERLSDDQRLQAFLREHADQLEVLTETAPSSGNAVEHVLCKVTGARVTMNIDQLEAHWSGGKFQKAMRRFKAKKKEPGTTTTTAAASTTDGVAPEEVEEEDVHARRRRNALAQNSIEKNGDKNGRKAGERRPRKKKPIVARENDLHQHADSKVVQFNTPANAVVSTTRRQWRSPMQKFMWYRDNEEVTQMLQRAADEVKDSDDGGVDRLCTLLQDVHALVAEHLEYGENPDDRLPLDGLRFALAEGLSQSQRERFLRRALPMMIESVLRAPPVDIGESGLEQDREASVQVSAYQALSLLSASFFGLHLVPPSVMEPGWSDPNMTAMWAASEDDIGDSQLSKVQCLFNYFDTVSSMTVDELESRSIRVHRYPVLREQLRRIAHRRLLSLPFELTRVRVVDNELVEHFHHDEDYSPAHNNNKKRRKQPQHQKQPESRQVTLHSIFASSRRLGGRTLTMAEPSQEDAQFLVHPEALVAMHFTQSLADHEAVVISGAQRFSLSQGTGDGFRYDGPSPNSKLEQSEHVMVAMDALPMMQYVPLYAAESMMREIVKAFAAFSVPTRVLEAECAEVRSGNWGCSRHSNMATAQLRAMLQWISASLSARSLVFCTNSDPRVQGLASLTTTLYGQGVLVNELYQALSQYPNSEVEEGQERAPLFDWLLEHFGQTSALDNSKSTFNVGKQATAAAAAAVSKQSLSNGNKRVKNNNKHNNKNTKNNNKNTKKNGNAYEEALRALYGRRSAKML